MPIRSPHPDVEIPEVDVFGHIFADLTPDEASMTAIIDAGSGVTLTYGELVDAIDGFAGVLRRRGIGTGDVVALLSPNSVWFAIAFHAILRAGGVATTISTLYTPAEIARQLRASRARMVLSAPVLSEGASRAAVETGLGDDAVLPLDADRVLDIGSDERAASPLRQLGDPATRVAVLPFSSGTTGNPKGVMLTHRNLVANIVQCQPLRDREGDDVILAVLPFFHIYGLTVLLNTALHARARLITMPHFDFDEFMANIESHRVTTLYIVPPIALALAKHPGVDDYDLSSVRAIVSAAAPLDQELGEAVAERIGVPVSQGFGMTELSPLAHGVPADLGVSLTGSAAPIGSIGWPVANTDNKLIDPETGVEIGVPSDGLSRPGELLVRGPNVMLGYLDNPQATREAIDEQGFLRTGDLARVDSAGRLYIVDRLKELIKYKGYQVAPAELEALLLTHPDIDDAAVVSASDDDGEEIPKAFVVARYGSGLTTTAVMSFVADQVAPHKKVRRVEFIDAIPKSLTGKILRKHLRAREVAAQTGITRH
ncbi:AMP-binding protein [Nocardia sp. NPDC004085]